jgi:hypothetical protein
MAKIYGWYIRPGSSMEDKVICPVGKRSLLDWELLRGWCCYRVDTIADGSCLFHAIFNGVAEEYRTSTDPVGQISQLRKELSKKLTPAVHSQLLGGNLAELCDIIKSDVDDFTREGMVSALNSRRFIGYGFMEYIGDMLGVDIYVLNAMTEDVYISPESPYCIKGRPSVIILVYPPQPYGGGINEYGGHYELVAREVENNVYSLFKPDHPLIEKLKERLRCLPTWQQ